MHNILTKTAAASPSPQRPVYIRLPKPGTLCPWTGLNRWKMWEVVQEGKVKNANLVPKGRKRGVRLIHLDSLLARLEALTKEAA